MRSLPTKQAMRSFVQRIACLNGPQRERDHSIPSMLITFLMPRSRCRTLNTAVL